MKKVLGMIRNKILSDRGDSIAEVLIALLISSVALVMLASMITSSVSLTDSSKDKISKYYSSAVFLADQSSSGAIGTGEARITNGSGDVLGSYSVSYFLNDEVPSTPVVTYKFE